MWYGDKGILVKGTLLSFCVLTNSNCTNFYVIHIHFNLVNYHVNPL